MKILFCIFLLGYIPLAPSSGKDEMSSDFDLEGITSINGLAFSPDGKTLYVSHYRGEDRISGIFSYRFENSNWVGPEPLPFNSEFADYQATLSPDGKLLFFVSRRPLPGTQEPARQNVWFSRMGPDGWEEPEVVEELISPEWDGHAMLADSGWLYYASGRPGGKGDLDIYKCKFQGGSCSDLENLETLNSEFSDNDIYVDPKERFIIFQRTFPNQPISKWGLDIFYSLNRDGNWTIPQPIEAVNTEEAWELSPTVFPACGKLFFNRTKHEGFLSIDLEEALGFSPC